jgi:hypothetical protein
MTRLRSSVPRAKGIESGPERQKEIAVTYQIIRQAIVDRRCASALYENYVRVFCPRTIGKDAAGTDVVEVFQYGGGCPGGLPFSGKWCSFRVADVDCISINGDVWQAGTGDGTHTGWMADVDVAS